MRQRFGHLRHFKARNRKRKAPIRKTGGVGCSRGAASPCRTAKCSPIWSRQTTPSGLDRPLRPFWPVRTLIRPPVKAPLRVGQKNKLTYRWARKGSRPRAAHDQRTQSTYLFGAVCPELGSPCGGNPSRPCARNAGRSLVPGRDAGRPEEQAHLSLTCGRISTGISPARSH